MYLFYRDHFAITSDQALKRASFYRAGLRKGASNLFSEIIGTFVLVFVIFYFTQGFSDLPGTADEMPIGLG